MGEPAGIGPDLTLKIWLERAANGVPPFYTVSCPDLLRERAGLMGLDVPLAVIRDPAETAGCFPEALPVLALPRIVRAKPGKPDVGTAAAVLDSIEIAVAAAITGDAAGIVTNPIHKASLYAAGFTHPGHTEFLASLAGPHARVAMMLAIPGLRVVPVTVHRALADAIAGLKTETIVETGKLVTHALQQDFGIDAPRLAVAGLNPHAGEAGTMGREEVKIIAPAVAALRQAGIEVKGPLPADTMFHEAARASYDAALCMYHDQALIPLKTLNFYEGVNITLGLPFVRTSPDHGTALDIAGSGKADPRSLAAALRTAAEIARHRAPAPASA